MRIPRLGVLVLIALGMSAVFGTAPAGAVAGSSFPFHFDSGAEGWESTQEGEAFAISTWSPSIGNPGGGISLTDENAQAYDGFFSPESFGGNFSSNYGGTLSFDIASSNAWGGEEAGLAIYGVAREELAVLCAFDEGVIPGPGYQTADLVLDGAHTFRLNLQTGACGSHPSGRVVSEVLSNLLAIYIPAEDVKASNDVTEIDNVDLSGGAPLVFFKLTVRKRGEGTGTVTGPAGIDCGAACTGEIEQGGSATLSASPGPGSTFAGWSGGGCSGTEPCTVTVSADSEVTALFEKAPAGAPPNPKALRCKKGFRKRKIHGRFRCVKHRKRRHHHHRRHHHV
jgi:hypothetical protein